MNNEKSKTYIVACANRAGGYPVNISCHYSYEDALKKYEEESRRGGFIMLCVTKKEFTDSEWEAQNARAFVYDRELSDCLRDSYNDRIVAKNRAFEFETSKPINKNLQPQKTEALDELKDD